MPNRHNRLESVIRSNDLHGVRAPIDSVDLQVAMSDVVLKMDWVKTEKLSLDMMKKFFSELLVLKGEYQMAIEFEKSQVKDCERMIETGNKMMTLIKDKNFRNKLKKADRLKQFQRATKDMQSGCKGKTHESPYFSSISRRMQYLVAIGYTGFWGGFHAKFNHHLSDFIPKPLSSSEISEITKIVRAEQLKISKKIIKLYSATGRGNREEMSRVSFDILRSQRVKFHRLSKLCASICAVTRATLKEDLEGDPNKLGMLDLLAGKLARSWILLIVWALYVIYLALLPPRDVVFQEIVKTAKKLPFTSKNKKTKLVSPHTLSTEGKNYHEKYLHINGFVKNLTTGRTQDGKFLNVFEVYEAESTEAVKVAVIFEHMGHRGLVNTSYVDLYGTWKEKSPLADTPVLHLERRKISELKNRFGFENMLIRLRPWFDYFPNSYHAYWSVRPQKNTEGSGPKGTLTGAGELIIIEPFFEQ